MRGDDGRRIDDGIAFEQGFFAIGRVDPHGGQAKGRLGRRFAGQGDRRPLRIHHQQHAGTQFAATGFDFLDAQDIGIRRQLQIVLNAHGGHDKAHIARQLPAQAFDLIGQTLAGLAVDEAEQGIAKFEPDHVDGQSRAMGSSAMAAGLAFVVLPCRQRLRRVPRLSC